LVDRFLNLQPFRPDSHARFACLHSFELTCIRWAYVGPACMMQVIERQATEPTGNKLDAYDMEVPAENKDALRDLAEFQLAMVRPA